MKKALTIAGSDASGGAGIEADLKTFAAHGVYGACVVVSVVAENTCRVLSAYDLPPKAISDQLDAVFEDISMDAVKIGMLSGAEQMKSVAAGLLKWKPGNVVIDPVMLAKGGHALMHPDALSTLCRDILPLAFLLTPNIPEAEAITGMDIRDEEGMCEAARRIQAMGAQNVLVKGGHADGAPTDVLLWGGEIVRFPGKRIESRNTHGTGCTLSSAIAANLSNGQSLPQAVENAKHYVTEAIRHAVPIGHGQGPLHHFYSVHGHFMPQDCQTERNQRT
ncbi:MAG: bifunctional hydroxymethylpyrimidine kinase/phosphomethylpyrimidine kinase [Clostridiales bacterium]|nr:bifunctional hydroxymethylpyrimidine kinase/phosphomethylpyrimidine kinase [Clostridiales bacterium]